MVRLGNVVLTAWHPPHVHHWITVDRDIVAERQKGAREVLCFRGDYQECECGAGRFVPKDKRLSTVGCEKVNT